MIWKVLSLLNAKKMHENLMFVYNLNDPAFCPATLCALNTLTKMFSKL